MEDSRCVACLRPRATLECGLCSGGLCRDCSVFLETGSFSFLEVVPDELTKTYYCQRCYDAQVAPVLDSYSATMERAKSVFIFFKTQRKPIPLIRKTNDVLRVVTCPDRDETILRLAFRAAEKDFNAVIDADVTCEKVRNEGYQKMNWRGTGHPAAVDEAKMARNDLLGQN